MTFQPCPGIAEVVEQFNSGGQIVENVYHVQSDTPWTVTLLHTLLTTVQGWESATGSLHRHSDTLATYLRAKDLTTQNGPEDQLSINVDGQIATGDQLPNNVTFSVKAQTGIAGRAFRGRTYWVGMPKSYQDSTAINTVLAARVSDIVGGLNTLLVDLDAIAATPVVLSRYLNNVKRGNGIGTPIVSYAATDNYFDSQRRRLPGHNRHRR